MISYIGLGSNLGDSIKTLQAALAELHAHPEIVVRQTSSFYQSKPHYPDSHSAEQPDYINAVAKIETRLAPLQLLDALQRIEKNHHRVRSGQRWEPRTLDLDLLLYENKQIQSNRLTIPHPGIGERDFVIYPLAELNKDLTFPNGKTLTDYLSLITDNDLKKLEN